MSNKLSQSEIDALVASLLANDAASQAKPPGQEAEAPKQGAAADVQPPAASGTTEFDSAVDLGPVTQAELDAAAAAARATRKGDSQARDSAAGAPGAAGAGVSAGAVASTGAAPAAAAAPGTGAAGSTGAALAAGAAPGAGAQSGAGPAPGSGAPSGAVPSPGGGAAAAAGGTSGVRAAGGPAPSVQRIPPGLRDALLDIELTLSVELGRTRLALGEILEMGPGSVITLDRMANEPLDVKVSQLPVMKAEVIAIGENYGIRIVETRLQTGKAS